MIVKLYTYSMRYEKWFPRVIDIPADREESFRDQARRNHSQTVERLNERGGLSPDEIYCAFIGSGWIHQMTAKQHMDALQLCVDLAVADKAVKNG